MYHRRTGFTLVESAVALLLLAGLSVSALMLLQHLRISADDALTESQLEEVRAALVGYAIDHARLPCPSDPLLNDGIEARVSAAPEAPCRVGMDGEVATGVLPWATLGAGGTDAWGRRLTYSVDARWATTPYGTAEAACDPLAFDRDTSATPTACQRFEETGRLSILERTTFAGALAPPRLLPQRATDLVAVVVSHGANGRWAFGRDGMHRPGTARTDDEAENAARIVAGNERTVRIFVMGTARSGSPDCDDRRGPELCAFDDRLIGLSRSALHARLVAAAAIPAPKPTLDADR